MRTRTKTKIKTKDIPSREVRKTKKIQTKQGGKTVQNKSDKTGRKNRPIGSD